ncbi:MAG: cell division protein SepF [Candidatus Heimdallarchaeota archaeon]|nr:cell division protein SepF [Candidatus Heimdallarchaeota archaeon]
MGLKRLVTRNSTAKNEEIKIVNQPPSVKFYSLLDVVKTERIIEEVEKGNLVFLNIGRISAFPERKRDFLKTLKDRSSELHATLKMVSEETVMVAPHSVPIEIRSLSPLNISKKNRNDSD